MQVDVFKLYHQIREFLDCYDNCKFLVEVMCSIDCDIIIIEIVIEDFANDFEIPINQYNSLADEDSFINILKEKVDDILDIRDQSMTERRRSRW